MDKTRQEIAAERAAQIEDKRRNAQFLLGRALGMAETAMGRPKTTNEMRMIATSMVRVSHLLSQAAEDTDFADNLEAQEASDKKRAMATN